ncbi:MAG TPA: ArsC family reductase [Pseudomonadales bacterium]
MTTLYGIPNCDTVKKARTWLDRHGIAYEFHDYKKLGIDAATLAAWCADFGYEQVLNTRGTTFRKLNDAQRADMTQAKAIALMQEQPSLIKRPLLDTGKRRLLGFSEADYRSLL